MTHKNCLVLFLIVLITFLAAGHSRGQEPFPEDFYPVNPHPRLWLTQDHLAMLEAARQSNTPQWQEFHNECLELLSEVHWGGAAWGVPGTALMYLMTGDGVYLNRSIEFMLMALDEPFNSNDAGHGLYGYLGLGYDWLYNHMSTTDREAITQKMIHWSNYVWVNENGSGSVAYGQDTDHVIMTGSAHLMMGAALYGDSPEAIQMLDRAWWIWSRGCGSVPVDGLIRNGQHAQPVRRWVKDALGGMFYPGWVYFSGTDSVGLHQYYTTLRTACGYDIYDWEPELKPFWGNVITATMHLMLPSRDGLYHTGDWQDPNTLENTAYFHQCLTLASWEADLAGDSFKARIGRGLADSVDSWNHFGFLEFFFRHPTSQVIDPYTAGLDPITRIHGCDYMFYRNNWSTTSDWTLFSGQGGEPADHQMPDTGNFVIYRQNDFLTKDCRIYGPADCSVAFNVVSIENALPNGSTLMSEFDAPAVLERSLTRSDPDKQFLYGMVQGDNQWDEDPNEWEPILRVDTYRRHFVRTGEYAIVLDRLKTSDIGWRKYRLRSLTPPSIDTDTQTINQLSPNGQHRLLHRTLIPDCELTIIDETAAWTGVYEDWEIYPEERKWQVEIQPPDGDTLVMLNVMQTGPASLSEFDNLVSSGGDSWVGASLGDHFFQFSNTESLRSVVSYSLSNVYGQVWHFIADLESGVYSVEVNGQPFESLTVSADSHAVLFRTEKSNNLVITLTKTTELPVVTLQMPANHFQPGDPCYCRVTVENTSSNNLSGYPLWVILDVYGVFLFAPDFRETDAPGWPGSSCDYYLKEYEPGSTVVEVIPEFFWPNDSGEASGIYWYAALTDSEIRSVLGNLDSWMFSWSN